MIILIAIVYLYSILMFLTDLRRYW